MGRLPRPLLAGVTSIAIVLMALTIFWGGRSQVHAAPVVVCEIKGMICQGCARQVGEILSRVPGVRSAQVDAKTARARVVLEPGTAVSLKQLSAALDETKVFQICDVSVTMEAEQP
jgi:copper chaperone CopZ